MSPILTYEQRIDAFTRWGSLMQHPDDRLQAFILSAQYDNAWFTPEQTEHALSAIAAMLNKQDLEEWFSRDFPAETGIENTPVSKKVGLILAGNIPMVGFHDILCVLAAGHQALIKLSSNDKRLIPFLLDQLVAIEPAFAGSFQFIERLTDFDAVIATGSTNTSRYFEYYFSKVPHIIRKNRTSIAILTGNEMPEALQRLGHDIFDYFGLGCRNVSKLYVPEGYQFTPFFEAIESFKPIGDHHKYNNNYDYNKSIMLVNGDKHFDNGFLLVRQDPRLTSPLAVVHYEEYADEAILQQQLTVVEDQVQCITSDLSPIPALPLGSSQEPKLWDYADGVNTIQFLAKR